jgi:hypothetical protein
MKIKFVLILSSFFCFSLIACRPTYVVRERPAEVVHKRSAAPSAEYVWIGGNWIWRGGRYVWEEGHWERRRTGVAWVDGHWKNSRKGWTWEPGHWRRI